MSPRRHLVAETPCHKQMSHLLKTSENQHRRHSVATEMLPSDIIEESPEKAVCEFQTWNRTLIEPLLQIN